MAASFIWGINTIFLLDAGLSNFQAFLANAFFTAGQVIFEVPTGVVADTWGRRASYLLGAALMPIRQAYLNGIIPSKQRATVLSFDSLMGSSGGIFIQPILGRAADIWNYSTSYAIAAGFQLVALPFILLARKENPKSDPIKE